MIYTETENLVFAASASNYGSPSLSLNPLSRWLQQILEPVAGWLDKIEVHDQKFAHLLTKLIPAQCPFERDLVLWGRKIAHIPPMCKLNPLYDQLVGLRFRALCYLVDECGELG